MYVSNVGFYSKNLFVKKNPQEFKKIVSNGSATYAMVTLDSKIMDAYTAGTLFDFDMDVGLLGAQRFTHTGAMVSVEVIE